jgi:hypothetical protein
MDDFACSNRSGASYVNPLVAAIETAFIHTTALTFAQMAFYAVAPERLLPIRDVLE